MNTQEANVIRSFIAMDFPDEILAQLEKTAIALKKRLPNFPVRWVPTNNIHLTIRFLGNVSKSNIEILKNILENQAKNFEPFEVSVGGLGAFPSKHKPKVLWVGLETNDDMIELKNNIDAEVARLGYAREKRGFSPHLTLGRISRNANLNEIIEIGDIISKTKVGFLGATRINQIHLYQSILKPSGAVYSKIFTANFS